MRSKINILVYSIAFICLVLAISLAGHNKELLHQIEKRDSLLNSQRIGDSIYNKETQKYSEVINKYITNCEFTVNGKRISTSELLEVTNAALNRNIILEDSIRRLKYASHKVASLYIDSSNIYKKILELAKRDYGISYSVAEREGYYIYTRSISRADSALVLFPYYKSKISRDTSGDKWVITTEKVVVPEVHKRKKKR